MGFFKRIINKICGKDKQLTIYEQSELTINEMREKGSIIGENVHILNSYVDMGHPCLIEIGNNTTITGSCVLTHDACLNKKLKCIKYGRVKIGNNCFITKNSMILPGTIIGNNVIVGGGCVVAKDIPDNVVVVGNPMKILYSYDEFLEKNYDLMSKCPVIELDENVSISDEILKAKTKDYNICYVKRTAK